MIVPGPLCFDLSIDVVLCRIGTAWIFIVSIGSKVWLIIVRDNVQLLSHCNSVPREFPEHGISHVSQVVSLLWELKRTVRDSYHFIQYVSAVKTPILVLILMTISYLLSTQVILLSPPPFTKYFHCFRNITHVRKIECYQYLHRISELEHYFRELQLDDKWMWLPKNIPHCILNMESRNACVFHGCGSQSKGVFQTDLKTILEDTVSVTLWLCSRPNLRRSSDAASKFRKMAMPLGAANSLFLLFTKSTCSES